MTSRANPAVTYPSNRLSITACAGSFIGLSFMNIRIFAQSATVIIDLPCRNIRKLKNYEIPSRPGIPSPDNV